MPEFKESQTKYTQLKNAYRAAAREAYLARQQCYSIEKQIESFLKAQLLKTLPAVHPLNIQIKAARKKLTDAEKVKTVAKVALDKARLEFNNQGTANQTIANLNDHAPILLLPLRVQTRFLTIKHIARDWPVEIMVDSGKLDAASRRMINTVNTGKRSGAGISASKNVQAFSLSNTASATVKRLVNQLNQPPVRGQTATTKRWRKVEDEYELWVRMYPDDIFLQTHETAITETERAAALTFWQGMWDAERTFRAQGTNTAESLRAKKEKQLEVWKALRFECHAHRATWIARAMRPAGFPDDFPLTLDKIPPSQFPDPGFKSDSWTLPPTTEMLPEHFIVNVFFKNTALPAREVAGAPVPDYVQLGFDPDEKDQTAFSEKDKVLELPKEIRWLTDIAEAEKMGMAIRIPLSKAEFLSGVSTLVVIGIKTGADETESITRLTSLIDNHHYRPDGMAFLRQGTPTNNLPGQPSGFTQAGTSDEQSFDTEFPSISLNHEDTAGQFLSTALGLDQNTFSQVFNNQMTDGKAAITTNRALWAGTLGYYLNNHLRPAVTDTDIRFIKDFFQQFVTGRGLLPAFRVGKQPYGIIPATAWSAWKPAADASVEEKRLIAFLKKMDDQWNKLVDKVMTMKKAFQNTDEQQLKKDFRELLTYQSSSTRFFRRMVAGEYLLWNVNNMAIPLQTDKAGIRTTPNDYKTRLESAAGWNEPVNPRPQILGKFFDDDNYKLTDLPPDLVTDRNSTNDNGANYLSILLDATIEQMRTNVFGETFNQFVSERSSKLLFYTARFALLQGWIDTAVEILRKERPAISPLAKLDFEMEYTRSGNIISPEHKTLLDTSGIAGNFETLKNKWSFFEQTLNDGTRVDNKILQLLSQATANDNEPLIGLKDSLDALKELSTIPVDDLERLFSEHVDLCSFRLDAWLQGLALSRLFGNRKKEGFEKGLFIGAFGYLENISPGNDPWVQVKNIPSPVLVTAQEVGIDNIVMPVMDLSGLTPAQLQSASKSVFVYLGSDPSTFLVEDPVTKNVISNPVPAQVAEAGYLLTPSLEHAAAAGILRAGYEHHGQSQGPESKTLAVNIDSERTGKAVDMLKGVKAGHSLNE
ncbi:MAG TPA: hypothetical protein VFV68_12045, partial [Agriterribacter sp.]|nr:hypothetical protein [Agriterribacter sp.]